MAVLFTREQLASYAQVAEVDNATSDLLLELVTAEIRNHVGGAAYDAMADADQLAFKAVALEAARRAYLNPEGLRETSGSIDDYTRSKTFAVETFGGVELTQSELDRIDRILGRSAGAFTIRPYGQPDCPPWVAPRRRLAAYLPEPW